MMKIRSLFVAVFCAAASAGAQTISVAAERDGREPKAFIPMVGHWVIATDEGQKVVMVDGRAWKRGQPAGGLADKARTLYGASHEEFIDNVKAFAYFPIAIARDVPSFSDGTLSVKFKMIGGTLDRASGILFNVKPNGDYLAIRFNGTEDNLVLWKFVNGTRSFVKRGAKNAPLELGTWHEIKVVTKGTSVQGYLDGELLIEHTWETPISGKVGLWSKTDSMSEFTDFTVTPEKKP
jgi:hypothetical protein